MRNLLQLGPLLLFVMVGLSGCPAPVSPPPRPEARQPQGFPEAFYRQALSAGKPVYRVDPSQSQILIYAYSTGPLGPTFGHDHVVSTHNVQGYALAPTNSSAARADVYLEAFDLNVDEPELRKAAGFEPNVSAEDAQATRNNMLSNVLEAEKYPFVVLHAQAPQVTGKSTRLQISLTVHGVTRTFELPAELTVRQGRITVSGKFKISHRAYGMVPYSVLGGGLRVKDGLDVTFKITALRMHGG